MENNLGNNSLLTPEQPQVASPIPPQPSSWYKHKGIIAIIMLAVIVGVVSWLALSRQPNVEPVAINNKTKTTVTATSSPPQIVTTSTSIPNWVTYNDKNGFEFQFPPDWTFNTGLNQIFLNSPSRIKLMSSKDSVDVPNEMTVSIVSKTQQQSIAEFANTYQKGWFANYKSSASSTIANKDAVTFSDIGDTIGSAPQEAVFIDGGQFAVIFSLNDYESSDTPTQVKILNQILSTFSFVQHKPVTIKEIEVKAGVDVSPQQDATFVFLVAKGHYLLWTYDNNRILYDGQEVYSKDVPSVGMLGQPTAAVSSIGLSKNGLHYGYAVATDPNRNDDLYIDGQKIISDKDIGSINISDDGKTYMYSSGNYIIKNGQKIYQDGRAVYDVKMSEDGSTYIATEDLTGGTGKFILNGQTITTPSYNDIVNDRFFADLSDNGKHYIYQNSDGLFVDGQFKFTTPANFAVGVSQITDEGHYTYCDRSSSGSRGYVDDKAYAVCGITINSDASHFLQAYDPIAYIDSKPITWKTINPQPQQDAFELDGDILYAYSLVK